VPNFLELAREHKFDLDAQHVMITPEMLDFVHSYGGIVNVWTVDEPERAEELIAMGVDQITTNICE
jgi:glycerophosphoryl diester phosphodiesterase